MDIYKIINRIYRMSEASTDKMVKHLSRITYSRGCHILEAGKTKTNTLFIEKGTARAHIPIDGKKVTLWTEKEGSIIASLKSYVDNQQEYESMELTENSVLHLLKCRDLHELLKEDTHTANWGRRLTKSEFLRTEERLISLLFTTVSERYMKLMQNNPELLQRIPLGCLAPYLGMTSVSLSRIRAKSKRVL